MKIEKIDQGRKEKREHENKNRKKLIKAIKK
jgi:hypothetical protein